MITIKTKNEIDLMHESGKLLASCHKEIAKMIKPGITTQEIDTFVEMYLKSMVPHLNRKVTTGIHMRYVHL